MEEEKSLFQRIWEDPEDGIVDVGALKEELRDELRKALDAAFRMGLTGSSIDYRRFEIKTTGRMELKEPRG